MNLSAAVEIKLINSFILAIEEEKIKTYAEFEIIKNNKVKNLKLEIDHEWFNNYKNTRPTMETEDITYKVFNICENFVEELKTIIRENYSDSDFINKDKIKGIIKAKFVSNNKLEFESSIKFYPI